MLQRDKLELAIATTRGIGQGLRALERQETRVSIIPNGVNAASYNEVSGKQEARARLGLGQDRAIALYTGSLFSYKGVYVLADAARHMPDVEVLIVGGSPGDIANLREYVAQHGLDNVLVWGSVPPPEIPVLQGAADVLVAPNTDENSLSTHYTSPLKLFEYMAAQRPIVASDLPSIREVLRHDRNALLVPPNDPAALAASIREVAANPPLAERLSSAAYADVREHTWENRARRILATLDGAATPA